MIAVIDTETTGAAPWARAVEIAVVAFDPAGEKTQVELSTLVRPDILDARADRALAYSGITRDELEDAPDPWDVRDEVLAWLEAHGVSETWAYNMPFDRDILARSGYHLPWKGCVMRLARLHMPPRLKDPSLKDACDYFCVPLPQQHRALADARAAAAILRSLRAGGR